MHVTSTSTPHNDSGDACISRGELESFLNGEQRRIDWDQLNSHLQNCSRCESLMDEVSEVSDFGVQLLSTLPPSSEDEPEYRELHSQLLSTIATFSGDETIDELTFDDIAESAFADAALPVDVDRYQLLESIGSGATGTVYRARHRELERDVAIKILSRRHSMDRDSVDRFRKEIRAIGQLKHPNIIHATDAGHVDDRHYLVMEYADGASLSEVVQQHGPLSVADACEVIRQAALGLAYAHEQKMVHRDVKLSNLLLTYDGTVKLLDLGLVAIQSNLDSDKQNEHRTESPRGTADYMPPEQWTHFHQADHRSDLYSLGCTLFKLLTGTAPFFRLPDGCHSKRDAHLHHKAPELSEIRTDVPAHLHETLNLLLAKQPEGRIQSAAEVAKRVARYSRAANLKALLPNAPFTEFVPQPIYQRRKFLYGATAAIVIGGVTSWRSRLDRKQQFVIDEWHSLAPSRPLFLRDSIPGISNTASAALPAKTKPPRSNAADTSSKNEESTSIRLPPSINAYEYKDGKILIDGPRNVLLNLGRPTRGIYSFSATFEQSPWHGNIGFFFGYQSLPASTTYDTIRIVRDSAKSDTASHRIIWQRNEFGRRNDQPFNTETTLAEAMSPVPLDATTNQLTVTLGRDGIPEVTIQKTRIANADWALSFEGRQRSSLAADHRKSAYMGRLGVACGWTRSIVHNTRLQYHAT